MKWGEYSSDVQFILQRSDQPNKASSEQAAKNPASSPPPVNESPKKAKSALDQSTNIAQATPPMDEQNSARTAISENIEMSEHRKSDSIGIAKGKIFLTHSLFGNKIYIYMQIFFRSTTHHNAKSDQNFAPTFAMFVNNWNINNNNQ